MQRGGCCPALALRGRKGPADDSSPPRLSNSLNVQRSGHTQYQPRGLGNPCPRVTWFLGGKKSWGCHSQIAQAVVPQDPSSSQPPLWSAGSKGHPTCYPPPSWLSAPPHSPPPRDFPGASAQILQAVCPSPSQQGQPCCVIREADTLLLPAVFNQCCQNFWKTYCCSQMGSFYLWTFLYFTLGLLSLPSLVISKENVPSQ